MGLSSSKYEGDRRSPGERVHYPYQVDVGDDGSLGETYRIIDLLEKRRLFSNKDWIIDMRGGETGRTSFYFRDRDVAILLKLQHVNSL